MPQLIGGLALLQKKVKYPEMARRAKIEGRVTIQFIVNEQGEVENPRVIRRAPRATRAARRGRAARQQAPPARCIAWRPAATTSG